MKKTYEKPTADVISFQLTEELSIGGETGVESAGDLFEGLSLDIDDGYKNVP